MLQSTADFQTPLGYHLFCWRWYLQSSNLVSYHGHKNCLIALIFCSCDINLYLLPEFEFGLNSTIRVPTINRNFFCTLTSEVTWLQAELQRDRYFLPNIFWTFNCFMDITRFFSQIGFKNAHLHYIFFTLLSNVLTFRLLLWTRRRCKRLFTTSIYYFIWPKSWWN